MIPNTQPEPDFEALIKPEDFRPTIVLAFRSGPKIEVYGTPDDARRFMRPWNRWRVFTVKDTERGRMVSFRGRDLLLPATLTAEAQREAAIEQARASYAEHKKLPNPGKAPQMRLPGGRIVTLGDRRN